MKRILVFSLLFLLSSGLRVLADFELLLDDGQLLSGVDVRRDKGQYLLELGTGQVLSIPAELVSEVRITAGSAPGVQKADPAQLAGTPVDLDDDERPASGLRRARPDVLAGEMVRPPRTSEQLALLGEPSRFSSGIVDPDWRPESDWGDDTDVTEFSPSRWSQSVLDPEWEPRSDYTQESDKTYFNPSRWHNDVIDPRWAPEDAFKNTNRFDQRDHLQQPIAGVATPPVAPPIARATTCTWCPRFSLNPSGDSSTHIPSLERGGASSAGEIRSCAKQIFEPLIATRPSLEATPQELLERMRVTQIDSVAFNRLPIQLYEGTVLADDSSLQRAVFTYSAGNCRLIGGDLTALLGVDVTEEQAADYGTAAYNSVLAETSPDSVRLDTDRDKLDYALAVSALVVPGSEDLQLLTDSRLSALRDDPTCSESRRVRRSNRKQLERRYAAPRVESGAAADVVTFSSWNRSSGVVWSHRILLLRTGEITMRCEIVAEHLGEHQCDTTE